MIQNKCVEFRYGFSEPDRGNLDDPETVWREGKPDYTLANYEYLKGKSQNHNKGNLELFEPLYFPLLNIYILQNDNNDASL